MVGTMILLKMLHCKRMCANKTNTSDQSASRKPAHDEKSRMRTVKKESMDNVCRVCLKEGNIPIYGNDSSEDISNDLNMFGGLDIKQDDPYPKFICQSCCSSLQGAILFRKTAQQSDEILKNPRTEELIEENDNTADYVEEDNPPNVQEAKMKKEEGHRCRRCNIKFESFKKLHEHKLSDEHENMRHVCPYCHKTYAPLYYKKHLELHTKPRSFVCDVCGKEFVMQGHFARHRLTHFYKLPFKCSLCPYKGRFSESLKMHMRSHTGERPYQCTECPSRFISKSNLNKHMLTHKDEPDFKCDTCGRGFHTKREIEQHYKVDHAGVKDHVCKICGKVFGYRKQMMKHELKVHKRAKMRSGRTPIYLKVESMQEQGQKVVSES